jgi:hypothetical protein
MTRWRLAIGTTGALLLLFGIFRLVTQVSMSNLLMLAVWLVAAAAIHDGILSPLVVLVGAAIARTIPPRARRYVQAALIVAAPVTVIAIPLIDRRGTQPRSKAILLQDYGAHLTLLIAIIATVGLLAYAIHVAKDSGRRAPELPPANEP